MDTRICHRCGTEVGERDYCPICTDELKYAKPVDMMSLQERADEFDSWFGVLEVEFSSMHGRLEQLVGRGIFMHEFAGNGQDYLRREILNGKHPETVEDTMRNLSPENRAKFIPFDTRNPSDEGFSEN